MRQQWLLFIAYASSAAAAVTLTRFDGGVAFLWGSTAILIAALLRTPTGRWFEPLAACGVASFFVTGFLGLGWAAAAPFTVLNLLEAYVAACLFRKFADTKEPMQSLDWLFRFAVVVGVVAPLVAGALGGLTAGFIGKDATDAAVNVFTAHSLGNLTFTPLALLVTGRKAQRETLMELRRRGTDVFVIMSLVSVVCALVFTQEQLPLLFLPVLFVILAAFRTGREGAAIAVVIVAIIGGAATISGHGAIQLMNGTVASELIFFQFYLAATVLTVLPVSADLQNRRRMLRKLRVSEERFRLLAEHSTDILMHIAVDGRIRYISPSVAQLGGYRPETLIGQPTTELIAPDHVEQVRAWHQEVIEARGKVIRFRHQAVLANGETHWFETHSRALLDEDGDVEAVLSVARDIAGQKEHEDHLQAAALTDALTGLPNRRAFQAIAGTRTADPGRDCLALFDVDHFKKVNDRYGHATGDEVLKAFAEAARQVVRQVDTIARIGGEEFAILFPDTSIEQARQICERLRRDIASQELHGGGDIRLRVTISGGIARLDSAGLDEALSKADEALYRAKRAGRDRLALAA